MSKTELGNYENCNRSFITESDIIKITAKAVNAALDLANARSNPIPKPRLQRPTKPPRPEPPKLKPHPRPPKEKPPRPVLSSTLLQDCIASQRETISNLKSHLLTVSNEQTNARLLLKAKIDQLRFEAENIKNDFASEKMELEDIISTLKLENKSMRIELERKFASLDKQLAEKMGKIENQEKEISELQKPDPRYDCKVCQEQVRKYI